MTQRYYLTQRREDELKSIFKPTKQGYTFKPELQENPIVLSAQDILAIHDFFILQGTEDFNIWLKYRLKELNNDY